MISEYPLFTHQVYEIAITESWRPPQLLVQVEAEFSNNINGYTVQYALLAGNELGLFSLDQNSVSVTAGYDWPWFSLLKCSKI